MSEKQTGPGPRIDLTSTHSSRKESKMAFVQCCSPVSMGTMSECSIVRLHESLKPLLIWCHTQAQSPLVCSATCQARKYQWDCEAFFFCYSQEYVIAKQA